MRTTAGPPATSVHVEVEPEELKAEVGEFGEVRGVSARIPEDGPPGRVRWKEQRLQSIGTSERESEGRRKTVKGYYSMHQGPNASERLGVGVEVETDRGRFKSPPSGHGYTVKDDSQPGESALKKNEK